MFPDLCQPSFGASFSWAKTKEQLKAIAANTILFFIIAYFGNIKLVNQAVILK
jgi:hypothetical protein